MAIFPLSTSIFLEINNIRHRSQRKLLRQVLEEISQYKVVMPRSVVATFEIEAMLDLLVGQTTTPIEYQPYLGWGVANAFGIGGGFRIKNESGEDITDATSLTKFVRFADLSLNRMFLDGPTPREEPKLRQLGWRPEAIHKMYEAKAQVEIEQIQRFDQNPEWRRGKIRDVVAARELAFEVNDMLFQQIAQRGTTPQSTFPTLHKTRSSFDSMPSLDVTVTMKTSYHRNATHKWTPNDIYDIDALSTTLPYCDIVVTDKAAVSHIKRTGLDHRLQTKVISRLAELPDLLQAGVQHIAGGNWGNNTTPDATRRPDSLRNLTIVSNRQHFA